MPDADLSLADQIAAWNKDLTLRDRCARAEKENVALRERVTVLEGAIGNLLCIRELRWEDTDKYGQLRYRCLECDAWEDKLHKPGCIIQHAAATLARGTEP